MKSISETYQRSFKSVITLLLVAFMLPMGLNAKHLADLCSAGSGMHHEAAHGNQNSCHSNESMDDIMKQPHQDQHHGDCGAVSFCTCESDLTSQNNDGWILPKFSSFAVLTNHTVERKQVNKSAEIPFDLELPANRHAPPLWLLYDTLLI
ncbi:MAG: hypothetical protein R3283_06125 [Balneolaceae bacterium]|nr:hypothetical protein [Balneolaceae bacterium]